MSSAERIRKRFLHKIGIPPQNSTEKSTEGSQSSFIPIKSMNTKVELSRLGAVKPTYEQLNVGLDDDSSFDEDDESDDDYYFDDDHFPSEMDIDTFIRNSQNESIKKMFSIDNKKSLMEENEVQTNPQRAEDSSLVGSINIVSDNGSANSSLDGAGTNLNSATPCYSIGKFSLIFLLFERFRMYGFVLETFLSHLHCSTWCVSISFIASFMAAFFTDC